MSDVLIRGVRNDLVGRHGATSRHVEVREPRCAFGERSGFVETTTVVMRSVSRWSG